MKVNRTVLFSILGQMFANLGALADHAPTHESRPRNYRNAPRHSPLGNDIFSYGTAARVRNPDGTRSQPAAYVPFEPVLRARHRENQDRAMGRQPHERRSRHGRGRVISGSLPKLAGRW